MTVLRKEDYEEPCCPLKTPDPVVRIDVGRMMDKLDRYLEKRDFSGAERHLLYWKKEAEAGGDLPGKLSVLNELIGLYRKNDRREEGLSVIREALSLILKAGLSGTVTEGTTLINAATAYKAFGEYKEALPLYARAQEIYESRLSASDDRLGGLYNNMALALFEDGQLKKAEDLFLKALRVMENAENGEIFRAITYCNLADLIAEKDGEEAGEEKIRTCLTKAGELLETPGIPQDAAFAYVLEKCAPTFGYYGFFEEEAKFSALSEKIYERA